MSRYIINLALMAIACAAGCLAFVVGVERAFSEATFVGSGWLLDLTGMAIALSGATTILLAARTAAHSRPKEKM